ncbi:MAG TPA: dynamin family protein [Candidatus Desulfovibrio intestinipullorum]|uniref:Dynamin family protein n=1 Tax=Candidatus Desulfovibrio intestinipullorum TaxID=2838536 RepID=A0A9D1PVQ4_9BACT|nr:dynamin family protein [Candidatus Desulfovibrio intestinipullorum]
MNLLESLQERQDLLSQGIQLVHDTRTMYDAYGKDVLSASYDRFDALEKGLTAKDVRMVVIGEFSRGKSSLLNALLGTSQLPCANEATTAINTFMYGLPENETVPYLVIVFRDGHKERVDMVSERQDELRKWGTELDTTNRDLRTTVDYIELYINHPLLNLGLVLIDTPGLESIQKHHEEITRRAIDTAHIAIWVLSAVQLGGNNREWQFLRTTIRKSFRKFLTVVNWWDCVMDPQDELDKALPAATREKRKMDIVRGQFHTNLSDVPQEELDTMTSDRNLFGVSARWALYGTPEQKARSGLDKLSARIQEICSGDEARAEIFYKPMKQLIELQKTLEVHLSNSLHALETETSLEQQKRECDLLDMEISNLEQNIKFSISEAKADHDRVRDDSIRAIREDIAEPLRDIKQEIEYQITPDYVRERILAKDDAINLPDDLLEAYKATLKEADERWSTLRQRVTDALQELRLDYARQMDKHAGELASNLNSLDISLPDMDVQCDLDLSTLETYYEEKMRIEGSISDCEQEIDSYNERIEQEAPNEILLQNAREALSRAERRLAALGPQPSPTIRQESRQVSSGGWFSKPSYSTVEVPDYTPVNEWKDQRDKLESILSNKEQALEEIARAEEEKTGRRLSLQAAKRRLEQKMEKMRAQQAAAEQQQRQELDTLVARIHRQLVHATSGQLDSFIRILEKNAVEGLTKVFDHQLQYLKTCVEEQFMDPLHSKQASREEAVRLFEQGKEKIEKRKTQLAGALQELHSLQQKTAACCTVE